MSEAKPVEPVCSSHDELVSRAGRWLRNSCGCGAVLEELVACTRNGEIPDAVGFRQNGSILVECKVSRSDFLRDRKKPFRNPRAKGVGNWRFYLAPQGLLNPEDCPEG